MLEALGRGDVDEANQLRKTCPRQGPKHRFRRLMLVSGDRESEVRSLAGRVGITEVHAGKTPEEKLDIVRRETRLAPTLYLGDGINDAPALMAATVGVALGQNSDITTEAAGAVIMPLKPPRPPARTAPTNRRPRRRIRG
jgi:cation transport ATPase